ncbi:exodeoxyribonuclease VII large subunit [Rickettsiales bacterium LUAb2]
MHIFTVKDLFDSIKITLEEGFSFVMVKGSISKIKYSSTGHLFFELKDNDASISCACWKDKINKLKTTPQENKEVTVKGYITAFKNGTNLHLIILDIEVHGISELLAVIEARKNKLSALGYFDTKYKKTLPLYPQKIAVITSNTGAVIEDIKHRINDRFPTKLIVFNATTQGEKLIPEIIEGIFYFNNLPTNKQPQVIIIARGGGSFEDLFHFNDELLVEAVFNSKIPIVSAVGHETDTTLIDYAADVRASTPTAAAELVTPNTRHELANNLKHIINNLDSKTINQINLLYYKVNNCNNLLQSPISIINNKLNLINNFKQLLSIVPINLVNGIQNNFNNLQQNLNNFIYSYINKKQNNLENIKPTAYLISNSLSQKLQNINKFNENLNYKINYLFNVKQQLFLKNSYNLASPINLINTQLLKLTYTSNTLHKNLEILIKNKLKDYTYLAETLVNLSHEATLKRGFTLIMDNNNKLIKRIRDFSSDSSFKITFYDGNINIKK